MNLRLLPMRLSIIIVSWNAKAMLRDCLASLEGRIDPDRDEVFVVDNGSCDQSVEMVRAEFPGCQIVANPDNRGFAAANNQAMRLARGEYILLLNNDTLVHGEVIEKSIAYLERSPGVAVMGCRVLNEDGSVQLTCSEYPSLLNLFLLTSGLSRLPWPAFLDKYQMRHWQRNDERDVETVSGCYMMVRASAIEQIGLLDEQFFFFGEETDWCQRFRHAGWQVRFAAVGEITHFGSVSARRHRYKRDVLLSQATVRLHRKHYGRAKAAVTWSLLLGFNLSRATFWTLCGLLTAHPNVRDRSRHFRDVVMHFSDAWPRPRTLTA